MTSGMAGVVTSAGAPFDLMRIALPAPEAGQVLVRLEAAGICHADLGARAGHFPVSYPVVLGHEGCGVVLETGPGVTELREGQRVVLTFDTCGQCVGCRAGQPARCSEQLVRNWIGDETTPRANSSMGNVQLGFFGQSSFAEYALVNTRNAIPVDVDVSPELLAPLGCGVQTGYGAVSNMLRPRHGDVVAVFGAGAVGLSAVMALGQVADVTVIAVDPDPGRRQLATELGAAVLIDPDAGDPAAAIRSVYPDGVHGAVECSGHASATSAAVRSVGQSGSVVLVGAPPPGTLAEFDVFDIVLTSKRIMGCIEGDGVPREMIPFLAGLIADGRLRLDKLVRTYPFADIETAADDMASGRVVKPVLTF